MKIVTIALVVLLSGAVFAGEDGTNQDHAGEEAHPPHTLAVFAGVTIEHGEHLNTLGLEYSYRINQNWSLGGVIERADREKNSTLAIAFAHYWPYKGLFLGAGIGRKDPGDARENTLRATIGYEFELKGGWGIAPQANIDFIEHHDNEEVYGIVLGKRF
jgi:hypothetical protein